MPKQTQEEIENLNKPIKESKSIVTLLTKIIPNQAQTVEEAVVLHKMLQKTEKRGKLFN